MRKLNDDSSTPFLSSKNYLSYLILMCILSVISACTTKTNSTTFDYGTRSDSARYYFLKGFEEILDNQRWTESETNFRKAVEFDPDWVLGKSLVARITRNLNEREQLLWELNNEKNEAGEDERLLVDVNLLLIEMYNNRDKRIQDTALVNVALRTGETNFGKFVRKYPQDNYFKAEYIELLHYIHGPKIALDSLGNLASDKQKKLGFYLAYSAELELKLGNIENAISIADRLKEMTLDSSSTRYKMLMAEIYLAQNSIKKAKQLVDKVMQQDSNHLYALRLQNQIKSELSK